jgi:hypothetical protein
MRYLTGSSACANSGSVKRGVMCCGQFKPEQDSAIDLGLVARRREALRQTRAGHLLSKLRASTGLARIADLLAANALSIDQVALNASYQSRGQLYAHFLQVLRQRPDRIPLQSAARPARDPGRGCDRGIRRRVRASHRNNRSIRFARQGSASCNCRCSRSSQAAHS